jgi:biofilm protein TabA
MIIDNIHNIGLYTSLNPLIKEVADFIQCYNLNDLEPGRIHIKGDDLIANIDIAVPKTKETAQLEAHHRYIDIQIPLEREETYGYSPIINCSTIISDYDSEKDIIFYADRPQLYFKLQPEMFVIFFPQDAHAPCIMEDKSRKIIFKLKDSK